MAVIGAGIAGLATAVRLAVAGHPVTVFEAGATFGGKMHQFSLPGGYRFDAGPSLFTLPQLVDDVFRLAHREPTDYFRYERLDPITNYFFADGTRLAAWADGFVRHALSTRTMQHLRGSSSRNNFDRAIHPR